MLLEALQTARDLGRLQEVASVLVRHGFGDLVRRLGVAGALRRAGVALHWKGAQRIGRRSTVEHVREALEELGPAFVKAGQLLADRTDLLPPAWTEELGRLRQEVAPAPWEEVRSQLVEDLGAEPDAVFSRFDHEPVAAASIAQVYRAELAGVGRVAVKVRRPGIEEIVEADLRLLARLAETAERELPELRRYRPVAIVRRLSASLRNELDLRTEVRNADRLRPVLADSGLVVPVMYERFTSRTLCVMEFLEGESLDAWIGSERFDAAEGRRMAAQGADAVLAMVLEHGFFHADPHPGNLVRLRDGRLGILDFGMVGRLSEARRAELFELLLAALDGTEDRMVDVLVDWSTDGEVELDLLTEDCGNLVERFRDLPLHQLDMGALLTDVGSLLRENGLMLPSDVAMLIKVFLTLEHVGRSLNPDFATAEHMEPFVRRAARARRSPFRLMRRGLRDGRALLLALPRHGRRLLRQLRAGRLGIDIRVRHLEEVAHRLDRSANRVTIGLITAALIVGTSIAMTVPGGPTIMGLPALGLLGFVTSTVAGLWVLWLILRSSRH